MTSELKNILLDIILPSVAVIAAGLYTYALTTGPEEYDDLVQDFNIERLG